MQIKIVSIGPTELLRSKNGKSYSSFELTFKNEQGKSQTRKIMSFNKETFTVLSQAEPGQVFDIVSEKKGDFWEWLSATRVAGEAVAETSAAPAAAARGGGGSSWKKSDPDTEVRIARSVALKAAVDFLAGDEGRTPDDLLKLSNVFEHYLMNGYNAKALDELSKQDTIPMSDAIGTDEINY